MPKTPFQEVFACHLVLHGCKNLPHVCYVNSFWPVVPFNVSGFFLTLKIVMFFGELWPKLTFDVKNFQNSEMQASFKCRFVYHVAKFLFLVSQWPPERRLKMFSIWSMMSSTLPNCLVATSRSGWFWCRFIEAGEKNHPWRTPTPRQAVKSLFMGFARVVLKNLPVKRTFRMNISRK